MRLARRGQAPIAAFLEFLLTLLSAPRSASAKPAGMGRSSIGRTSCGQAGDNSADSLLTAGTFHEHTWIIGNEPQGRDPMGSLIKDIASFGALVSFGLAVVLWGEGLAHLGQSF